MNRIFIRAIFIFFVVVIALALFPSKKKESVPLTVPSSSVACEAQGFASGQLKNHFLKHGYQFGGITEEDYLEGARKLLNTHPTADILEKRQADGDIARYNRSNREFAVMTPDCRIRTYFIANDHYWDKQ